jgi:predicted acetyltransferase
VVSFYREGSVTVEVRTIAPEELEAAVRLGIRVFSGGAADIEKDVERELKLYPPEWCLGAFEGSELAAMMRVLPSGMYLNGGCISTGVVSPVGSSALYRRRGHAGALLRRSLEQMRERGQWLSALYTPHPALYRRYGWEIAGDERWYEFKPKDLRLTATPSQRGRLRAVALEDWQELAAVYDAYARNHNGPLARDELWWRHWVLETWSGRQEAVLWTTDDGRPEGYMLYADPAQRSSRHAGKFVVTELIATSSDAYLNLIDFISQQDIRPDAVYYAPPDDVLPLLFSDAERLEMHHGYTVLLRVVDIAEALRERAPASDDLRVEFTVSVSDSTAPWNEGTWHVQRAEGGTVVERTDGPAELSLDARTLAPVFNGYISPSQAAAAGLIGAAGEDTLHRADAFFAGRRRPYFTDRF